MWNLGQTQTKPKESLPPLHNTLEKGRKTNYTDDFINFLALPPLEDFNPESMRTVFYCQKLIQLVNILLCRRDFFKFPKNQKQTITNMYGSYISVLLSIIKRMKLSLNSNSTNKMSGKMFLSLINTHTHTVKNTNTWSAPSKIQTLGVHKCSRLVSSINIKINASKMNQL